MKRVLCIGLSCVGLVLAAATFAAAQAADNAAKVPMAHPSHEYTDVKYSSSEQGKTFDNHRWLPVYGGVQGSNPPEEQYQYIAYWYSSGK